MPKPTDNPEMRAHRELLIGVLLAMKRKAIREGRVKPDPTATVESLRELLMTRAREYQRPHAPAVWRWQDDLSLTEPERIRRWLMTLVVPGYPSHHASALSPLGKLTPEQSHSLAALRADYEAGRIMPPWQAPFTPILLNQGTER